MITLICMCGIFGFIRSRKNLLTDPVDVCIQGLKLLEYRGYDSSGIAGIIEGKIQSCKRAGKICSLQEAIKSQKLRLDIAIAHTRWATHGIPNQENAHPHFNQEKSLALVHNGIIENHNYIRDKLKRAGTSFHSETDTEVIAHLISHYYRGDLRLALQKALRELQGSLAIALIHQDYPNEIFALSRESPLVLGIDTIKEEAYLSSDANSFNGRSLEVVYLKDDELAILKHNGINVYNILGEKLKNRTEVIGFKATPISKNGYEHFMLKEIHEQPETLQRAMNNRLCEESGTAEFEELQCTSQELQSKNRALILACGTSWHAGSIAATMLEHIAHIPAEAKIASEFRYTRPIISKDTLVIAISQSGETADTLAAVREAKASGAKIIGICNVPHSSLSREADTCLFLRAGPEISVCSTKAFTSQLTVLALFTLYMARMRHLGKKEGQNFLKELKQLPAKITQIFSQSSQIATYAKRYSSFKHFFFMGRRYMVATSLEAALKLTEISYLNAHGYPAGEMKHGPIALVSPKLAIVGMCGNLQTFDKIVNNLMEVKARGGEIFAFAPKDKEEILTITENVIWMPNIIDPLAPVLYSVGGQLFAYHIANFLGTDIDQPRNLAKSVTVE